MQGSVNCFLNFLAVLFLAENPPIHEGIFGGG